MKPSFKVNERLSLLSYCKQNTLSHEAKGKNTMPVFKSFRIIKGALSDLFISYLSAIY